MTQRTPEGIQATKDRSARDQSGSILQRAREVSKRLAERAATEDCDRVLPPETLRDLHEAGLLALPPPSKPQRKISFLDVDGRQVRSFGELAHQF